MLRILYDKDKLDAFARVNSLIMPYVKWYMENPSYCILSPEKLIHYKTNYFLVDSVWLDFFVYPVYTFLNFLIAGIEIESKTELK